MILVDSSVWIDYFNGVVRAETYRLDALLGQDNILMGDIILAEVLQGFSSDTESSERRTCWHCRRSGKCWGEVVLRTARNYRLRCKQGLTVRKRVDVMIGTFCVFNNVLLLHKDRDFEPIEKWLGLVAVR